MAEERSMGERFEQIAEWATHAREQIDDLTAAMVVSTEEHADGISYRLAELKENRETNQAQYADAMKIKAQYSVPSTLDDAIKEAEARATLDAPGINPKTEKLYTVQQCEARVTIALAENKDHQKLITEKRKQKMDLARAKATIETLDREAKEYGRAVDILTARLNNLTARTGARSKS